MSRYTYTLNPSQGVTEKHTYRQSELEKMTTFHPVSYTHLTLPTTERV